MRKPPISAKETPATISEAKIVKLMIADAIIELFWFANIMLPPFYGQSFS
jgi:hypothetical protein